MGHHALVISPETAALRQEGETLRLEVARLLVEADQLVRVVKGNLLALYQREVGAWELRRLESQCAVARLKRKIALVQASVNRGEPVRETALEAQLEAEFVQWQARIAEAAKAVNQAKVRLDHLMTPEDAAELRQLYLALVKGLHPDLHPDLGEPERLLWLRVQEAYDNSDLEELRALRLLVDDPGAAADPTTLAQPDAKEKLTIEREALKARVKQLLGEMAAVRAQPPFTLQRDLEDAAWVAARREALDAEIATLQAQQLELQAYLARLLPTATIASDDERQPIFGRN